MSDNSNGSGQAPTRFEGLGSAAAFVGRGIQRWSIGLAAAAVMGCAPFALGVSDNAGEFLRIFIALLVLLAAAAVLGAGLGLLFGMPREADERAIGPLAWFRGNNNLIKVSDWVTTIIVGLSLVSLRAISDLADDMTAWIENLLGVGGGRAQFGLLLCVIGAVGAFVVSYIWTTINFRHTLEGGELDIRKSWQPVVDHLATEVAARAVSDAEVVARHSPPAASPIAGFVSVRDNRK